jgi:hypothetical protein
MSEKHHDSTDLVTNTFCALLRIKTVRPFLFFLFTNGLRLEREGANSPNREIKEEETREDQSERSFKCNDIETSDQEET